MCVALELGVMLHFFLHFFVPIMCREFVIIYLLALFQVVDIRSQRRLFLSFYEVLLLDIVCC